MSDIIKKLDINSAVEEFLNAINVMSVAELEDVLADLQRKAYLEEQAENKKVCSALCANYKEIKGENNGK